MELRYLIFKLMYGTNHLHCHVWNEDFSPSHSCMELRPLSLTLMHGTKTPHPHSCLELRLSILTLMYGIKTYHSNIHVVWNRIFSHFTLSVVQLLLSACMSISLTTFLQNHDHFLIIFSMKKIITLLCYWMLWKSTTTPLKALILIHLSLE